ncbi:urease subunit alpha [Corynebacterium urogenitale]
MSSIDRSRYAEIYGPTEGDVVRLADTNLRIRIEKDYSAGSYGDESVYGGGKAVRDGMAQDATAVDPLDSVIVGAIILDATAGVVKGDVGIKNGRIVGTGKAGNPNTQDGVDPELVIGPGTEVIVGTHRILTAGGVDSHIHYITPQQAEEGLSNGITTFFGGGTGPAEGTLGTTSTPGADGIQFMLRAAEGLPVNTGFLGKGSASLPEALRAQIAAGAAGLKVHEDWGATPAAISNALDVCDEMDVQLAVHTDTLNESGFFQSTARAIGDRTIHTFHSEGAGGGHAPDILRVTGMPNVLPSSTNPTLPYTVNSVEELLDMVMVCHHLSQDIPEDVAFADSRVRAETIAAETVLHDMGLISIFSSDSQAMGRVGESWALAFQTAHHCREQLGELEGDSGDDNNRVLRYLAKLTINPALAQGIADHVGTIEKGKLADLVLWPIDSFAAKPHVVLRQGRICWAVMGDPNASLATPQPVYYRDQFANYGRALAATRTTFMSEQAIRAGVPEQLGLESLVLPVRGTRTIGKKDMVRNERLADIQVDPDTYEVRVDGEIATIEPATSLPLAQLHYLF